MDLEEVKIVIRSLINSSQISCRVRYLLRDFKQETGMEMPLFGHSSAIEFLQSIPDTVKLGMGNDPEVYLVESEKSVHVTQLVQEQRKNPKFLHIKPRVTIKHPQTQQNRNNFPYSIPKLVEAFNRNPPQMALLSNMNAHKYFGRYKWCTLSYSHTCTQYCVVYEQNRIKYFNDILYNAKVRDYNAWRDFQPPCPPLIDRSPRAIRGENFGKVVLKSPAAEVGEIKSQKPAEQNAKDEIKSQKPAEQNAKDEIKSQKPAEQNAKDENHDSINSFEASKISESSKEKLRNYIKDHPKGVHISELLGLLAIQRKNSQLFKKSVTAHDIITSCSSFSTFRENKLYPKDAQEIETKHVPKVTAPTPIKELHDKKKIEIDIKLNESIIKESAKGNKKKSNLIFEDFDENLEMDNCNKKLPKPLVPKKMTPSCNVNDRVQTKLKNLIKEFPRGLWCCDVQEKYYEKYKASLDFREFSCTSMIQMAFELPNIFRIYRPDLGDWILFDASVPITEEEKKYIEKPVKSASVPKCIKADISKLLLAKYDPLNDLGIFIEDICEVYHKMYRRKLDYESLGFNDLRTFLESLEDEVVHLIKVENTILVTPVKKKVVVEEPATEAIPPINPDDDLFFELFPNDVFGPNEKIKEIQLQNFLEVGSIVEITVAEVWNPHRFYVNLQEYDSDLQKLMKDLQYFFSQNLDKYEMPSATIQPKQICAAYYNDDNEVEEKWHRAEIIKIVKSNRVSVSLIDFGTEASVKPKGLRFLPKEYGDLPAQAVFATLAHVQPLNNAKKWLDASNKRFLELVREDNVMMEVLEAEYKEPRLTVSLFKKGDDKLVSIADCLINEELAAYSQEILAQYRDQNLEANQSKKTTQRLRKNEVAREKPILQKPAAKENSKTTQCSIGVVSPIMQEPSAVSPSLPNYTRSQQDATESNAFAQTATASMPPSTQAYNFPTQAQNSSVSPELDPLTKYVQAQMQLREMQMALLRQQQLQAAEEKKQINNLALSFLMTNPDIKRVAEYNLESALRLATSLAEAFYSNTRGSVYQSTASSINLTAANITMNPTATSTTQPSTPALSPNQINQARVSSSGYISPGPAFSTHTIPESRARSTNVTPEATARQSTSTPMTAGSHVNRNKNLNMDEVEKKISTLSDKLLPLNISNTETKKETTFRRYVKEVKLEKHTFHLINLNNKPFVCAEELRLLYTPFSSWNIVEQVLASKRITYDFEILTRDHHSYIIDELEAYNSFTLNETEKDNLKLLPLNKVTHFLFSLQRINGDAIVAWTELLEDFDPNDSYWKKV